MLTLMGSKQQQQQKRKKKSSVCVFTFKCVPNCPPFLFLIWGRSSSGNKLTPRSVLHWKWKFSAHKLGSVRFGVPGTLAHCYNTGGSKLMKTHSVLLYSLSVFTVLPHTQLSNIITDGNKTDSAKQQRFKQTNKQTEEMEHSRVQSIVTTARAPPRL